MRVFAATALALLGLVLVPGQARAHATLIGTNPGAGAKLTTAPKVVVLAFDNGVLSIGADIDVKGPNGTESAGITRVTGTSVSRSLNSILPNGAYIVLWRATTSEGHLINGSFPFTLDAAAAPSTAAAANPTVAAPSTGLPAVVPILNPVENHAGHDEHDSIGTGWIVLGYLAMAAAVGTALITERARRRRSAADPARPSNG
jgi:methionine-rich copper-binding protein CopC